MYRFKSLIAVLALAVVPVIAFGQSWRGAGQYWNSEDKGEAVRVHNTSSETVVITITGDSAADNTVVIGSTSTTLDCSGAAIDTIAEFAAAIEAAVDSNSKTPLETDTRCVAATSESMDDELMAEAVTIRAGDWGSIRWDTSDTKDYNVYIPSSKLGASRGPVIIDSVYGNVGGTGDITLNLYVSGPNATRALKYQKIIESPVFLKALVNATNTSNDVVAGMLGGEQAQGIPFSFYVGANESCLIRAARATTGTTGGLGCKVTFTK